MMHLTAFEGHGRTTSSHQRSENQGDSTGREETGLSVDLAINPLMEKGITVGQSHHILLAEDDEEMRTLLAWWLRRDGYEVSECDHGIDLINQIDPFAGPPNPEKYDLVISDIRMPGITGLEVLEDVRHFGTECPPVILITAFGTKETHEKAHRLGAAAMFDKPFDFNDLLSKVHELLPPPS